MGGGERLRVLSYVVHAEYAGAAEQVRDAERERCREALGRGGICEPARPADETLAAEP
jgi:hypothetical protein